MSGNSNDTKRINETPLVRHDPNSMPPLGSRALEAHGVRTPWDAFVFGIGTRANIRAYQQEARRMYAIGEVFKAQIALNTEIEKAHDGQARLGARRELAAVVYQNEIERHREALEEDAHRRVIAMERRKKELLAARTETLEAKHGLEAEHEFKEAKFAAGRARFEAKVAERGVDTAVAKSAAAEAGEKTEKPVPPPNENTDVAAIHGLIQKKQKQIEESEADGKDTAELRQQLAKLKELLVMI